MMVFIITLNVSKFIFSMTGDTIALGLSWTLSRRGSNQPGSTSQWESRKRTVSAWDISTPRDLDLIKPSLWVLRTRLTFSILANSTPILGSSLKSSTRTISWKLNYFWLKKFYFLFVIKILTFKRLGSVLVRTDTMVLSRVDLGSS